MSKFLDKIFNFGAFSEEAPRGNNKGVTLLSLVITIIVIVILAGIGLNQYLNVTQTQAVKAKALNEFIEIENAVFQRGHENKLDAVIYPLVGEELNTDINTRSVNSKTYGTGYYVVTETDLLQLGVNSTENSYIVNYNTGEVIVIDPYLINGRYVYTKKELLDEETGSSIVDLAEYSEEKGINKPIVYSGMLPVKKDGGDWIITSKDDPEWYDYTIVGNGPVRMANVMLLDGVTAVSPNGDVYSNERLRVMDLKDLVGFKIDNPGSMFVWLPRYTYKQTDSGISIVYSKLMQDYTVDGYIKAPSFYFGEYTGSTPVDDNGGYTAGGRELSGIWISKYEAMYVN